LDIAKAKRGELGFCTKAGHNSVADIQLSPDETFITGIWTSNLGLTQLSTPDLLDAYANCPNTPKKVFQFVRRYGPVCVPAAPGQEFTLTMDDWLMAQADFRRYWDRIVIQPGRRITLGQMFESWGVPVEPSEFFTFRKDQLVYKANTLHRLLVLELYSLSPDRVRKCRWPDCQTPYYIAHHRNRRYCGETCQTDAQRQHARKYYHKTGRKRRRDAARKST
jgi:hypothetical protein